MNRSASLALVIQSLRPVERPAVAGLPRARLQRERVAARRGLRQRVRADASRPRGRGSEPRLLVGAAPAENRVDHERVLHVDEHADRRIDARQLLDGEDRVKKPAAAAAEALGNLDAHHAEVEQAVDERAGDAAPARPSRGRAAGSAPAANSRTLARISRSSSVSVVSDVGASAVSGLMRANGIIRHIAPAGPSREADRFAGVVMTCAVARGPSARRLPPSSRRRRRRRTRPRSNRRRSGPAIDSVSVDVTVTDKQGRPVTDLTPADFEIREAGKVQTIDTFKLVAVDDGRARVAAARHHLVGRSGA